MIKGRIIPNTNKKKIGTKFIISGRIPENATIDQIVAMVVEQGKSITGIPESERTGIDGTSGTGTTKVPVKDNSDDGIGIGTVPITSIGTNIGEPISGIGEPVSGDNLTGYEDSSYEQKDVEDEKKKRIPPVLIGKCVKIGTGLLAAAILITGIATLSTTNRETYFTPSDKVAHSEASDIFIVEIEGQQIRYSGSVIPNPGTLIHDQRDSAIGENNGTRSGLEEYFEKSTYQSRIAEEEKIIQIAKDFDAQQALIDQAQQILQNSQATDSQKYAALQQIQAAKQTQYNIYEENLELYLYYDKLGEQAHRKNGGDERTEDEIEMSRISQTGYFLAMDNLRRDNISLGSTLTTIDAPQQLFDETAPVAGTTDKNYVIDTELFGKPIRIWKQSSTFYVSVNYDTDIQLSEGHQVGEGNFTISADEIVQTDTTKNNIFAVSEIVKRLVNHQEIGDISIFGRTIHSDDDITK